MRSDSKIQRHGLRRVMQWMHDCEKKVLRWWMAFARRHRESSVLPVVLLGLLYLDAFVMVIPSTFILIGATMISPKRWWLFAIIFGLATAANNATTYALGRMLSTEEITRFISHFDFGVVDMQSLWGSAQEALKHYGPFATFLGALGFLPTQFITALIGAADAQSATNLIPMSSTFWPAILLSWAGHSVKSFVIAALARFGWMNLEKRLAQEMK